MSTLWLIFYILSAPAILIILWYYQYCRYQRYLEKIPGPNPIPVLGNALDFNSTSDILPSFVKYRQQFQGNFKIFIGFEPILIVSEQKMLEFILSSTKLISKSKPYRYLHNWLGTGILTSTDEKWKRHRKLITPAFHFQILEVYLEVFNAASKILVKKLSEKVGKGAIDIYPYITTCALDIICESAMGTSVNAQENNDSEYVRSVKEMCRIVVDRAFSPTQQYDFFYYFTKNYQIEKTALKLLHDYTRSVIRRKKLDFQANPNQTTGNDFVGSKKKKMAFLDLLLSHALDGDSLTDTELREEVDTLMFEKKAFEEIKSIFANDRNRPASHTDLQEMKYLDLVIKETLRIYPAVPFYGRELAHDVEYDGKILPKGLSIILVPYSIQRDPLIYPHPEKFDPDRFLPENTQGKSTFTYLPFSAGPRNCIGQKFAVLEMKATLSKVLRNFEVLPVIPAHKVDLVSEAVLKSRNGILMQLKKRNWDL